MGDIGVDTHAENCLITVMSLDLGNIKELLTLMS